ncbi:hypothetical protein V7148_11395 [Gottfriedia acidiceleris]|uniref:hypothetical protein n=1 Tax=Gottfriedia acidiceleris TaxID=371036 RepID=UPI002FFF959E
MARGNPSKIADYTVLKAELSQVVETHFNEEHPYVNSFDANYLDSLRTFAEENPDDKSAQIRYSLQKERYDIQEKQKTSHIDKRILQSELRHKISAGLPMNRSDLLLAEKLAKLNPSTDNLVLYSSIKQFIETERSDKDE